MKEKRILSGHFSYKTDLGKVRMSNEDRVVALNNSHGDVLLVVCDGMGGVKKGDFAATIAINTISDAFKDKKSSFKTKAGSIYWLSNVIRKANKSIYSESEKNDAYKGMGTTMTAVLLVSDFMVVAQVGDSRCYTIDNTNHIYQMTQDQTYVAYLLRTGAITEEEMLTHPKRHILMNALGVYPSLELDVKSYPYCGENLLLCSDGLYNNVQISEIESVMLSEDSVEQKINTLIAIANNNGGSDNIGIVYWESNR